MNASGSIPSITSTDSFAARAQKSESRRIVLWSGVLVVVLLIVVTRRWAGGRVMSTELVFWPTVAVLLLAILAQGVLYRIVQSANRADRRLPPVIWHTSAAFDSAVPMMLLLISSLFSPRGAVPALSAPPLLLMPTVVLLSILRLKPAFTLATGLVPAAFHILLAVRAIATSDVGFDPVYFGYGAILICMAFAAMFVAREVKRHVVLEAEESAARERADHSLAAVNRDLSVARDIQAGLLPSTPPRLDGFVVAGMSTPADQTGGDYYDWQLLPDGRFIAVMADVTGHGIGPALVMAVCRAYARASVVSISEPSLLMRRINELIHDDLPADRFITFALAMIEPGGAVQLISAGHGPSFLFRAASGELTRFGGDGLPLGVSRIEEYDEPARFQMQAGDILVLLTDGFFEWQRRGDDQQFGIARLERIIIANAAQSPQAILDALDQAVREFADGSRQQDDMTAVVIKRTD